MTDAEFLDRWHFWKRMLGSENTEKEPNTLIEQMSSMCWNIGVFQSTMSSWGKELEPGTDNFMVSPILFNFVFDNFFKSLCLSLRKITDDGHIDGKNSKQDRSVISIPSLLEDISEYRTDYTRRRLFLTQDFGYDVEIVRKKHDEYAKQFRTGQVYSVPRDMIESFSEAEHERWDYLSRCRKEERLPDDLIAEEYLQLLGQKAKEIKSQVEYLANKFYAHAATPESRSSASEKNDKVSLASLIELTIQCGHLVNSISNILSDAVFPFLAVAQFNKWDNWGVGWKASRTELDLAWSEWNSKVKRLEPVRFEKKD